MPTAGSRDAPLDVVARFVDRLSVLDADGAAACFAEEARLEIMFLPGFRPPLVQTGREQLAANIGAGIPRFKSWAITITGSYETTDPSQVISEWESKGELHTGEIYENRYIHIFRVVDGAITYWREYAHPEPLTLFFGQRSG